MAGVPIQLGDELEVEVVGTPDRAGLQLVAARNGDIPSSWTLQLCNRGPRHPPLGCRVTAWVFALNPKSETALVTADEFGRLQVSEVMRYRYLGALRTVLGASPATPTDADAVSEVQGMFGRVAKRDQPDWFSVLEALGRPELGAARELRGVLKQLSRSLREEDQAEADAAWSRALDLGLVEYLESAEQVLAAEVV